MTRKINTNELEALIKIFYQHKKKLNHYDELTKGENSQIKEMMTSGGMDSYTFDGYKALIVESHKDTIDEDMLLEILKDNKLTNCIKIVEVVDMDALENAIYNGKVPMNVMKKMDSCKKSSTVVSLRVSKK